MELTKVQLKTLIGNHIKREVDLQEVMEMMLNAMMESERTANLKRTEGNKQGSRPSGWGVLRQQAQDDLDSQVRCASGFSRMRRGGHKIISLL